MISTYLSNCTQLVKLECTLLSLQYLLSGVSQGSILGLLLFLIFINDLPESVSYSKPFLFADDLKLFCVETHTLLQHDFDTFPMWAAENGLTFHPQKTTVICSNTCNLLMNSV